MSPLLSLAAVVAALAWAAWVVAQGALGATRIVWAPSIWRFERADREPWPEDAVVLYGSSTFRLWEGAAEALAPRPVVNRGFGGARTSDLLAFVDRVIGRPAQRGDRPAAVVLYVANDISGSPWDVTPKRAAEMFDALLAKVRGHLPHTPVLWIEVNPTPRRWHVWDEISRLNDAFRAVCGRYENVTAVDCSPPMGEDGRPDPRLFIADQLHLNEAGYRPFGERLRAALSRLSKAAA